MLWKIDKIRKEHIRNPRGMMKEVNDRIKNVLIWFGLMIILDDCLLVQVGV